MKVKYDHIGIDYNRTRKADPYLTERLAHHLGPIKEEGKYLDIGCGTGNYTTRLYESGFEFIGIDPSAEMLQKAKQKNPKIEWLIGTAENTLLDNYSVNGVLASLTTHHWDSLEKGFSELLRVMKKGSKIVVFTSTPEQMKGYWLNHYFPAMLEDSMKQMPGLDQTKNAMSLAGIDILEMEKYFIQPELEDLFLYSGKHNPELYFSETVRNGISSFSSLANLSEVNKGLAELKHDIDSGKVNEIIDSYKNQAGDYLFIGGIKA